MSLNTTTLIRNPPQSQQTNYGGTPQGDDDESVDTEQLLFEKSKKEFNVKKVDFERKIKEMQTEKQQIEAYIKQMDNEVKSNYDLVNSTSALYSHLDEPTRRKIEEKDGVIKSLQEKIHSQ